ncbi:hypothetical protein BD324DRAFT_582746 [Kockovaella imperatae]|uniref:Alpha/Beta hydrolase protein n=1 Tax=Kockovaella imperatae TaxID=4999 RepID=A0A1Y1UAU6_9TREE|nr:hypothetical protein BD324DRAFT_582746 [Kockovaella imperatae]ORX35153.1 hypothetical protein BD324DRAFT_582746 [Kockovaella imperatae]
MSLPGILSTYPIAGSSKSYPYFTSGAIDSTKAVIFIGGLTNGLMSVDYVSALSSTLETAGWKLIQMHWSSAYDGYMTGSLDRDVSEMASLVKHLRSQVVLGLETVVLMGHSTGCQDVMHYLTSPSSDSRPTVEGGILQAPVSDREYYEQVDNDYTHIWRTRFDQAEQMVKEGKGDHLLDWEFSQKVGHATAYRLISLYAKGGDDDYFSSDLPNEHEEPHKHPLSASFGELPVPILALWSGNDEFSRVPSVPDLMARWEHAGKGKLESRIVDGAGHAANEAGPQKQLCEEVNGWLKRHF